MQKENILIIGGVAAGATAAARSRRLNEHAEITVLEAGLDVSFANCGLPYYIGGEIKNRSSLILQSPESFYDQYRVNVYTETEAVELLRDEKKVKALHKPSGKIKEFPYDKLILAQGGKPIVPPIPGADGDNVFQLWTLRDMDAIEEYLEHKNPKSAVVVGAGFIGLEMAEALTMRGLNVSVVEKLPQVMPNLEGEFAGYLQEQLTAYGVDTYTSKAVTDISEHAVRLDSGEIIDADMVLLSIGVKPTLKLAKEAGLDIGDAGGLLVNSELKTSDDNIFAAGDMLEIESKLFDKKVRIPLAGPANRQGRIAAANAQGAHKQYKGALGTSIVKLFDGTAGSTGMSLNGAREAGFNAEAVVVHKHNHTSYYPGAHKVSLMLIYDRNNGKILGAQGAGEDGVDKRLDVVSTAIVGGLTIEDLAELDLAYAPPFNGPNGPINMAAFTAENRKEGFSQAITAGEVDAFASKGNTFILDIRDPISFRNGHVEGAKNIHINHLRNNLNEIPKDRSILIISDDGQKGHVALRQLIGNGFTNIVNMSGGYISLERYHRALGLKTLELPLNSIEKKDISSDGKEETPETKTPEKNQLSGSDPIVIDVRTSGEYAFGAYPDAVNIPLDELPNKAHDLGDKTREITLYCASGARSAYGERILMQLGFTNVKNGGGLADMMA